jgi:hypothetical protein
MRTEDAAPSPNTSSRPFQIALCAPPHTGIRLRPDGDSMRSFAHDVSALARQMDASLALVRDGLQGVAFPMRQARIADVNVLAADLTHPVVRSPWMRWPMRALRPNAFVWTWTSCAGHAHS